MRDRDFGRAFGWLLTFVMFAGAVALGWLVVAHARARWSAPSLEAAALPASFQCTTPARRGDRLIITITHEGERLAARCTSITDPLQPERARQ